jgi:diphosphomevalonate decarboxylase
MMTSEPPYLLVEPNSIAAIQKVQTFRKDTGHPLYFTLDAGPNLHLLYPDNIAAEVKRFIRSELTPLCQDGVYIADRCGTGPEELDTNLS